MPPRNAISFAALAACLWVTAARADERDSDPWFGRDKSLHFVASSSIAAGTYVIAAANLPSRGSSLLLAGGVALTVGAGKELADLAGAGDASWRDFAWDAVGVAAGLGVAWGLDLLLRGVDDRHPLFRAPPALLTF